jgi:hypothetical protein
MGGTESGQTVEGTKQLLSARHCPEQRDVHVFHVQKTAQGCAFSAHSVRDEASLPKALSRFTPSSELRHRGPIKRRCSHTKGGLTLRASRNTAVACRSSNPRPLQPPHLVVSRDTGPPQPPHPTLRTCRESLGRGGSAARASSGLWNLLSAALGRVTRCGICRRLRWPQQHGDGGALRQERHYRGGLG